MKKLVLGTLISSFISFSAFAACSANMPEEPYVNICGVQGHKECDNGKIVLTRGPEKCADGLVRNCESATQPTCSPKPKSE
jgi:hypothetical protein